MSKRDVCYTFGVGAGLISLFIISMVLTIVPDRELSKSNTCFNCTVLSLQDTYYDRYENLIYRYNASCTESNTTRYEIYKISFLNITDHVLPFDITLCNCLSNTPIGELYQYTNRCVSFWGFVGFTFALIFGCSIIIYFVIVIMTVVIRCNNKKTKEEYLEL